MGSRIPPCGGGTPCRADLHPSIVAHCIFSARFVACGDCARRARSCTPGKAIASQQKTGAEWQARPHRRSRRAPRADLDDRDGFSRVRVWILGLSVPVGRGARRGIEAQTQWAMKSPTESSSSSGVSVDQCVHGECDSSTNAIVLVSRVVTDRMAAARLPTWGRIRGPTPLPLLMTIPVSFERVARSLVVAVAVNRHVVLRAIRKGPLRRPAS